MTEAEVYGLITYRPIALPIAQFPVWFRAVRGASDAVTNSADLSLIWITSWYSRLAGPADSPR